MAESRPWATISLTVSGAVLSSVIIYFGSVFSTFWGEIRDAVVEVQSIQNNRYTSADALRDWTAQNYRDAMQDKSLEVIGEDIAEIKMMLRGERRE
jgi:hypothetical protein